jgi:hypothetical protein
VLDLTDVLLSEPYECNNLARYTHRHPIRVGPGKEGPIMPTPTTSPGRVSPENEFISSWSSPLVFCTSTDGGIMSKYSQDIAAKPSQEPRMIASFDTMGLVPNNGGVGKQVVISVVSQLDRELGSNQGWLQLFDDA